MSGMRNVVKNGKLFAYDDGPSLMVGGDMKEYQAEEAKPKAIATQQKKEWSYTELHKDVPDSVIEKEIQEEEKRIAEKANEKQQSKVEMKEAMREVLGELLQEMKDGSN